MSVTQSEPFIQRPVLVAVATTDGPGQWEALGFDVSDGRGQLGSVTVVLDAPRLAWAVDLISVDIDGLPTIPAPPSSMPVSHPNGATGIDHVVVTTPDFDRTAAALAENGMPLRRIRDAGGFRQGFRRLGPAILELVEVLSAPPGPARFWGLVVIVSDLHALAERLGERLGPIKPAVQPGRHIATLRDSADLGQKVAFMDPEP